MIRYLVLGSRPSAAWPVAGFDRREDAEAYCAHCNGLLQVLRYRPDLVWSSDAYAELAAELAQGHPDTLLLDMATVYTVDPLPWNPPPAPRTA